MRIPVLRYKAEDGPALRYKAEVGLALRYKAEDGQALRYKAEVGTVLCYKAEEWDWTILLLQGCGLGFGCLYQKKAEFR